MGSNSLASASQAAAGANEIDHLLAEGRWIGGTGSGHVTLLSNTRSYMSTKPGQLQCHSLNLSFRHTITQVKYSAPNFRCFYPSIVTSRVVMNKNDCRIRIAVVYSVNCALDRDTELSFLLIEEAHHDSEAPSVHPRVQTPDTSGS